MFALLCVLCDSFEARGLSRKLSDDSFTTFYVYRRCATHSVCFCVLLAKDMIVDYEVIASLEWTLFSGRMKERIQKFLDDLLTTGASTSENVDDIVSSVFNTYLGTVENFKKNMYSMGSNPFWVGK